MSGRCDCGALDCPACNPGPRPRTEDECPRGSWWWPGEGAGAGKDDDEGLDGAIDGDNGEQKGSDE
jgi:hypothetical protein